MWLMHHSFKHHTYTGDPERDPDVINLKPYVRKTTTEPKNKYYNIPKIVLPYITAFFLWVWPG